jgi:flagellar biosynthetic protein FliR
MLLTPQFNVMQFVTAAVVIGVRMSSLLVFTPFPGGAAAPPSVKAGLALALTALLYPVYGKSMPALMATNVVGLIGNEMLIGLLMGLSVTFIFEAAQVAGQVVGTQVGFSLVNIIDPMTQVDTPVMSTLHQLIVMLIFLRLDVHHWLLRGAANSFVYLPANSARVSGAAVETLLHDAGGIWLAAVEIAAPILFATLLADVTLGFIGKASPQLQVLFLSLPAKTMLALVVWVSALALWPSRFEIYFGNAVRSSEQLLHLAK